MKMIKTLATKMVATSSLVALLATPSIATGLDAADMAFAFGGKGQAAQMAQPELIASARAMTQTEMQETEGAWLNFAIGGAIGLGSYALTTPRDQWTWGGAATSTALGVFGGYGAGVAGLRVLGPYKNTGGFGVAIGRPGITNPSGWYGNANQFGRIDVHRNSHSSFVHTHRGGWLR